MPEELELEELAPPEELLLEVDEPGPPDELLLELDVDEPGPPDELLLELDVDEPGLPDELLLELDVDEPGLPDELLLEELLDPCAPPFSPGDVEAEPHAMAPSEAQTNPHRNRYCMFLPSLNEVQELSTTI